MSVTVDAGSTIFSRNGQIRGVAVGPGDRIYAVWPSYDKVITFDSTGNNQIERGSGLDYPSGLAVKNGDLS
jgi:hypothetical protein